MASGLDEVDDGVDAVVDNVHAVDLVLGLEVGVETLLDVLDNGIPGLIVVNEVAKARSVNEQVLLIVDQSWPDTVVEST